MMEYKQFIMSKITPKINKGTIIELIYDDRKELLKLSEKSEFCEFTLNDSLKAIKKAIKYKLSKVSLFNIANLSIVIELDKSQYKTVLTRIEKHYAGVEDFEKCIEIKNLIDKI